MRCRIEPGFDANVDEPRYFIRWLEPWEFGWKHGERWEVLCLDKNRLGGASVQFGPKDTTEALQGLEFSVPTAVLDLARSGAGGYFDYRGQVVGAGV
jgi:hypothetical protein